MSDYLEAAGIQASQAEQYEILEDYESAFTMYKAAIVSLLSGVQEDNDVEHRLHVKEKTSRYLLRAEWIFNNYLTSAAKFSTQQKLTNRITWRSRSQLQRYKLTSVFDNILLVHDIVDSAYVIIKGVLKSSDPTDRSETCVLPTDVPYMVKLFALHETDSTVFFILEHVRYGKLWNHLEHYFSPRSLVENLDTELTSCATLQDNGVEDSSEDGESMINSNYSSNNDQDADDDDDDDEDDLSLSRLESSGYTDTQSCESLSSHDENYFDSIEDFARAKVQKLKEIRDFNERRQRINTVRPVTKTVSQVDLKSLNGYLENCRSHSLTDLSYDTSDAKDCSRSHNHTRINEQNDGKIRLYRSSSACYDNAHYSDGNELAQNELETKFSGSSIDVFDTQQLLQNAQKLIDSINETLARSDNVAGNAFITTDEDEEQVLNKRQCTTANADLTMIVDTAAEKTPSLPSQLSVSLPYQQNTNFDSSSLTTMEYEYNLRCCSPISAASYSIPSITEDYSVTALLQKKGITKELIKKWATEMLVAVDVLHQNGIICKDLNPANILLSDDGSVKLTYFFQYPNVERSLNSYAIERLYVAPELHTSHWRATFASDWWSFGAILYELVTSQTLYDSHPGGIYSHTTINIPEALPLETRTFLNELLRYNPNERLGSGICGADDIKAHPFFTCVNW